MPKMAKEDLVTTVSTRELKDGLSASLRRTEKCERIVVMRGKRAVAAIVPFETAEGLDQEALLRQLAARDLVELPEKRSPPPGSTAPASPPEGSRPRA